MPFALLPPPLGTAPSKCGRNLFLKKNCKILTADAMFYFLHCRKVDRRRVKLKNRDKHFLKRKKKNKTKKNLLFCWFLYPRQDAEYKLWKRITPVDVKVRMCKWIPLSRIFFLISFSFKRFSLSLSRVLTVQTYGKIVTTALVTITLVTNRLILFVITSIEAPAGLPNFIIFFLVNLALACRWCNLPKRLKNVR